MIDGIRRRFAKSIDKDPWDADQELEPETETEADVNSEPPENRTAIVAAASVVSPTSTNDVNSGEYYKDLVRTAIQNGGKYGEHKIPIPWLRMILAGLEWKRVDPEMMWYGLEAGSQNGEPLPEVPSFDDLFPADRDAPTGPR